MSTRRRYAATLLGASLALGGVALGACSGGDDPPSTSTTTGSSTSSTSSTTTPPTATSSTATSATTSPVKLPPEATKHTEKGAEAFVKFFVEQTNQASMNADPSIIPALSDDGCLSCQELQKVVVQLKQDKQHYAGRPTTIKSATAVSGAPFGQQFVRLVMVQNKVDVVDAAGKVVSTDPRAELARTASVTWKGDSWVMFGIAS